MSNDPKQQSLFGDMATTGTPQRKLRRGDLDDMIAAVKILGECPLAKYMNDLGYSPERYVLLLPERMRADFEPPTLVPHFVRFVSSTQVPLIVMRSALPIPPEVLR